MKKLIFVLAIFIAVPAFAALQVSLVDNGDGTVSVNYSGADPCVPAEMPRAFALDITIDGPGEIDDVNGYKNDWAHDANGKDETFESNTVYPGFGVYPARITWWMKPGDDSCDVNSYGTPLANPNDPYHGDGLDSNHIVLEFASLYYGVVNAPPAAGTLCKLLIDCGGATTGLNLRMIDEDDFRGGLVYEDGSLGVIDVNIIVCREEAPPCNEPVPPTTPTPANGAVGVSTYPTKPTLSWSPAAGGDNPKYDVYFGTVTPPVTVVSPNQTGLSYVATTAVQGQTYYWQIVAKNDCNSTGVSGPIWSFNTECMKSTAAGYPAGASGAGYTNWVAGGKPDCWCYKHQHLADIDGKEEGTGLNKKRVGSVDLGIFKDCYGKKRTAINGTSCMCADLDHLDEGTGLNKKAIGAVDLAIMKANYGKKTTQLPDPPPYAADYYYWTVAP